MREEEILVAATRCAETARGAEVELLVLAHEWAVVHAPDRPDPAESRRPGREGARRYGGEGVAEVCEFAAAELGAGVGMTTWAAGRLIADAQDLHHRHPRRPRPRTSTRRSPSEDTRAVAGRATVPGIYVWHDPHGAYYLVDHGGTPFLPRRPSRSGLHRRGAS